MTFYQLALRYLWRKKTKTVLLFLVLFFVCSMILSANMVLRATEESKKGLQEKTEPKIVLENLKGQNEITENEIEQIKNLDGVSSVNGVSVSRVFPVELHPITGSESSDEDNVKVALQIYDDMEKDSPFAEQRYRLTAGQYVENNVPGIVMNSLLADSNGLELGDEVKFRTEDGRQASVKIIGLYLAGSERKQGESVIAVNRIENQIFMDTASYKQLEDHSGSAKAAVYAKSAEQLKHLKKEIEAIVSGKTEITTSDTLYRQMEVPLKQITRVARLMLVLTLITGITVVSLLLCMWMRTRLKETAIFISIGRTKNSIVSQVFLETFLVFVLAAFGACGPGSLMAKILKGVFTKTDVAGVVLNIVLKPKDIFTLFCLGAGVILTAVFVSLIPVLRANPKDTLSKMEG